MEVLGPANLKSSEYTPSKPAALFSMIHFIASCTSSCGKAVPNVGCGINIFLCFYYSFSLSTESFSMLVNLAATLFGCVGLFRPGLHHPVFS